MERPVVSNYKELKEFYEKRVPEFFIKGELFDEFYELSKSSLSEDSRIGYELGSRGIGTIFEYLIMVISRIINGEQSEEDRLKMNIRIVYYIVKKDEETMYLRIKSLDY